MITTPLLPLQYFYLLRTPKVKSQGNFPDLSPQANEALKFGITALWQRSQHT